MYILLLALPYQRAGHMEKVNKNLKIITKFKRILLKLIHIYIKKQFRNVKPRSLHKSATYFCPVGLALITILRSLCKQHSCLCSKHYNVFSLHNCFSLYTIFYMYEALKSVCLKWNCLLSATLTLLNLVFCLIISLITVLNRSRGTILDNLFLSFFLTKN